MSGYVDIWRLLKDYVREFEIANGCKFSDEAWQRIKQLEADIRQSHWIEMSEALRLEREHRKQEQP